MKSVLPCEGKGGGCVQEAAPTSIQVFPVGIIHDGENGFILLEIVVTCFQVYPETLPLRIVGIFAAEVVKALLVKAYRENMHRDIRLPVQPGGQAKRIDFLDTLIGHRQAAYGHTGTVDIDSPTRGAFVSQDQV